MTVKNTCPTRQDQQILLYEKHCSEYFSVMDGIDRKIMAAVQTEGRASYAEIGATVGLSVSAVNERLKKLQASGAITGWTARINPAAVDLGILAFVQVLLDRPEHDAPFRQGLMTCAAVQECHHVTGEWSYLLKVRVRDTAALERFLSGKLKMLPGILRSHTVIALSSVKETSDLPLD